MIERPLLKMARRLGAAPSPRSFGDSAAQAGARRVVKKVERSAGIAPASPEWRSGILLLNDDRNRKRRRSHIWVNACAAYDKKERTPLPRLLASHPQDFSGGSF